MSKNRNRARFNKGKTGRIYKLLLIQYEYPIYWDECIRWKSNWSLFPYQWRMYKTWKHNRKTQWK